MVKSPTRTRGVLAVRPERTRDLFIPEQRHQFEIFATLVADDTYRVASEVHDLLVKTHPADLEKIELIKALVAEHLDIDRILDAATVA